VGYYWMAIDSIEAINNSDGSESTGVEMSFPPDVMFSYKAFVHPSYRGQGLYADLVYSACHWAHRNLGVNTLVSTTDWTNFAALRSCRRQGRKSLGLIWRFGLAGRYLTLQPSLAASYGIRVGQQAQVKARLCAAKRYWRYSLGIHTIAGFRAHAKSR
jgi:GNAT superfamily N-acetyltransferase